MGDGALLQVVLGDAVSDAICDAVMDALGESVRHGFCGFRQEVRRRWGRIVLMRIQTAASRSPRSARAIGGATPWILLTALLACLSALYVLLQAGVPSLWKDELYTVHKAFRLSLAEMVAYLRADSHPPIYYLVLRVWGHLAPQSTVGVRLFSWLAYVAGGCMMILQAHSLAAARPNTRPWIAACLAGLIAFCSPFPLQFAIYAKAYSWVVFLVALALWLRQRLLTQSPPARGFGLWLGLALVLGLAAASHYYAFFLLAALWIVDFSALLSDISCSRVRIRLLTAEAVAALPALAWIAWSRDSLASGKGIDWIGRPDFGLIENILASYLGLWPLLKLAILAVILIWLFKFGWLQFPPGPSAPGAVSVSGHPAVNALDASGLGAGVVMTAMVVLISFFKPFAYHRYFVVLLPALAAYASVWMASIRVARREGLVLLLAYAALAWVVACHDGFARYQLSREQKGAYHSANYRAVSLEAGRATHRYTIESDRILLNASDHVLKQSGELDPEVAAWRGLTPSAAETGELSRSLVLAATGKVHGITRLMSPGLEMLETSGFVCNRRRRTPPFTVVFDCQRSFASLLPENAVRPGPATGAPGR